jgi:serine protease Do
MRITAIVATVILAGVSIAPAADSDPETSRVTRRTPVVEVVERTRDSIVNLSSTARAIKSVRSPLGFGIFEEIFQIPTESTNLGSGFVIHPGGYIVTNAHVVARATELTVTLANQEEYEADIVASDVERDLAVIKIKPRAGQVLKPIPWGRSDDLMIGETAIAIGNPVGLRHTVTTGVISALDRDVQYSQRVVYRNLIQTDASINPGNSGGPLLNIHGQLIGINTAIRGDAQNIGFAIPVDQLREVLPEMLDIEKRYRVEVGMTVSGGDRATVTGLREDSPAYQAGLRLGDVLEQVDELPIREAVDYYIAMLGRGPGDDVRLKSRRNGKTRTVTLPLRAIPKPDGAALARQLYGMTLEPLSLAMARRLGVRQNMGLLVVSVDTNSPADRADMRAGDLLVQIGRHRVRDLDGVGLELERVTPDQARYIKIWRVNRRGWLDAFEGYIYAR